MRVAYCSLLLPEEKKLSERTKERLSGISGHKVTKAEILGIDTNLNEPVDNINIINTVNYPKFPQLVFPTEKWNHSACQSHEDMHLGYVNLLGIKYITQYLSMKKALMRWVRKSDEPCMICVHNIFLPAMLAAVRVAKKHRNKVKLCLNTGDIPGRFGLQSQYKKNLKMVLTEELIDKNIFKLAKEFDCFVFVTKDMSKAFDVEDKPFVVVECTYVEPDYAKDCQIVEDDKNTIFYAGSIREEYGISHMLRAFSQIEGKDYRLVIAGGGAAEGVVKEYEQKDPRIQFLGFITPQEVLKWQLKSKVLISPRQSDREYVKYSFPSKSVDSLASGVPYIAHKLPCDPPEYSGYINYPVDESDEALRDKIVEICEMSPKERRAMGERAKLFIIQEKNPTIMTKRIVDMWKKVIEGV
jgi:glycosyltransferase involved in cell wall biosynthesis